MVQVSCHRFGNCEQFVDQVFQWLHLRQSGQRAPIQFYIDVNFAEFQFGVLATIAGLATSHCVEDILAVDRTNLLTSACLACDAKSPLLSQVHRILVHHSVYHRHHVSLQHFQFHNTELCNYKHGQKRFGIWSLHLAMADKLWGRLGFSCTQMFGRFGMANLFLFHVGNMSIVGLAEPPAHISTLMAT